MLRHRIFAAAAVAVGLALASPSTADAAPVFLTPDINFVTRDNTFCLTPEEIFTLSVDTSRGDFMAINAGEGFSAVSGELEAQGDGGLVLTLGELQMRALVQTVRTADSLVGKDVLAVFRVDQSSIPGFNVGDLVAIDGHGFNGDENDCWQIKGDVAPVIPEPASLSLLLLGLGGMAGAARRKLA